MDLCCDPCSGNFSKQTHDALGDCLRATISLYDFEDPYGVSLCGKCFYRIWIPLWGWPLWHSKTSIMLAFMAFRDLFEVGPYDIEDLIQVICIWFDLSETLYGLYDMFCQRPCIGYVFCFNKKPTWAICFVFPNNLTCVTCMFWICRRPYMIYIIWIYRWPFTIYSYSHLI